MGKAPRPVLLCPRILSNPYEPELVLSEASQFNTKGLFGQNISNKSSSSETIQLEPKSNMITTAISYTNGWPHIGHVYEATIADVASRFKRALGEKVIFVTGTDEHGQKVQQTAQAQNMSEISMADKYTAGFQALNQRLGVDPDVFTRTTSTAHSATAKEIWTRMFNNGDIYLDNYSGWYLTREERFMAESEAKACDYKDPQDPTTPLKRMEEPSYFFRLSKFRDQLLKYLNDRLEQNDPFIVPECFNKISIQRLIDEELKDLSISRTGFAWGVEVPNSNGQDTHIMYVWFEALINYITAINYTQHKHTEEIPPPPFLPLPASIDAPSAWNNCTHIIGKDILWFHAVIWPCMLMSAGIPLPKKIVVHGFVQAIDGRKMSKSFGNIVNPHDCLDVVHSDTLRLYLARSTAIGADLVFSLNAMRLIHNAELCNSLGNLISRIIPLFPTVDGSPILKAGNTYTDIDDLKLLTIRDSYIHAMETYDFSGATIICKELVDSLNKFLQSKGIFALKAEDQQEKKLSLLRSLLEGLYFAAHLYGPFIPVTSELLLNILNKHITPLKELDTKVFISDVDHKLNHPVGVLFKPLEREDLGLPPCDDELPNKKQNKTAKNVPVTISFNDMTDEQHFKECEIRVGKIVSVEPHPSSEKLYIEQIDIGEEQPRTIASGLRKYKTLEQMTNARVLVLCNLKPRKMVDTMSNGMVICSSNGNELDFVNPPKDATVGSVVQLEGFTTENDNHKFSTLASKLEKNSFFKISSKFSCETDGIIRLGAIPWVINSDYCTSTVHGNSIS